MKDIRNEILFVVGILCAFYGIINVYNDLVLGYLTLLDVLQGYGFDTFMGILGIVLIYYSGTSLKLHNHEEIGLIFEKQTLMITV
jgi:1,4-dihydroxy-2-naphthoate octaprenyltransferase